MKTAPGEKKPFLKRVKGGAMPPEPERIQKILSGAGIASRRASEDLITAGRVTVNGKRATIGDRAVPGEDAVAVDGIVVETGVTLRYFALNKPRGVVTTVDDPGGRPTVLDLLDEATRSDFRLFPVGRLDMDSSGLILLTNDGFLANRLLHPSFQVPREYRVEVEPVPRPGDIAALRVGVVLEDGPTGPAKVSLVAKRERRGLVSVTLHTGKKRQIRRSFEHLGFRVVTLCRVRFGPLGLGSLKPGEARELDRREVEELYVRTGMSGSA